jgi:hypothetical protein
MVWARLRRRPGGLSTLRNLGRFASPVLAAPALAGTGRAAPFAGAALLSGALALTLSGWAAVCLLPGRVSRESIPPDLNRDRASTNASLCRT